MPERAALIAVLILDRPLCLDCIAARTNVSAFDVEGYLDRLGTQLDLSRQDTNRCRACGTEGKTYSVALRPLQPDGFR